jgi:murein DD-endopeptidase MepM/ murein hydrolase activator NlpD
MKGRAFTIIFLLVISNLLVVAVTVYSLDRYSRPTFAANLPSEVGHFLLDGRLPTASGGGEWKLPEDHISDEQRQAIETALAENVEQLTAEGNLNEAASTPNVLFSWPVQPASHLNDFGYHGLSNFVDQNPASPDQILDYACGERTYDVPGYNHRGTDIFSWPFPWSRMDNDEIVVVAAAPGVIVLREDGRYDRNCSPNSQPWNAVYVRHSDGTIAWYGHLKRGSLTPKGVGQTVAAGEYLGVMGSSGSSTGPHLHFELRAANNALLDPYAGACNMLNPNSFWAEQPPYYDTAVNKITTGYAEPLITECSTPEQSNEATEFDPGDLIYFTTYYRDQLGSQPSHYAIYRPDGGIYQQWQHSIPEEHYSASWWWWAFALGPGVPQGYWEFVVTLNGQQYRHTFLVGEPPLPPEPAVITLTTPNGGEVISPGMPLSITWETVLTTAMQVDLLSDEWLSGTLTTTLPISGFGRLTWTTPITAPTALYKIRVTDVLSPTRFDESDGYFVIGVLDERVYLPVVVRP